MVSMPNIKVEKPKRMVPVSFFLLVFPNMKRTVPTVARMGVKDVGFNMRIKKLSLEMPLRLKSHAVTVVPTFAPIITFIACFKVITPDHYCGSRGTLYYGGNDQARQKACRFTLGQSGKEQL